MDIFEQNPCGACRLEAQNRGESHAVSLKGPERPKTRVMAPPEELIKEEPLSIRIQGNPYSVVMRTPGDEPAHVAGFCLAEGILDHPDDIETIASSAGDTTNVVGLRAAARPPLIGMDQPKDSSVDVS